MNTYENYILKQLKRLETELNELNKAKNLEKPIYTEMDWTIKFNRISAQIDILYMILTGHDNKHNLNKDDE